MAAFSQNDELDFFINHLFLPPKISQSQTENHQPHLDDALLRLVVCSLTQFQGLVSVEQRRTVADITAAVRRQAELQQNGTLDPIRLFESLQNLPNNCAGAAIPLHMVSQNSGIMISKCARGVKFEAFELSATNNAVMSTPGRLVRQFPGPALVVEMSHFTTAALQTTMAESLSTMAYQPAPDMLPRLEKAGHSQVNERDTEHPGIITELMVAFLGHFSKVDQEERLFKNVRDDVLWSGTTHFPWRRSPLWLHLRVVLQLLFDRAERQMGASEHSMYKLFMLYILATVLQKGAINSPSIELDVLHCMSAKIVQRMHKLCISGTNEQPAVIRFVRAVLERSSQIMARRWSTVQQQDKRVLNLEALTQLRFDQDLNLALPRLDEHLAQMKVNGHLNKRSFFEPTPQLMVFSKESPLKFEPQCSPQYMVYNLALFEHWVPRHLDAWLHTNQAHSGVCQNLKKLMHQYYDHAKASEPTSHNPERCSVIFLTLLELWMALDKAATSQIPLLRDYDPGLPLNVLQYFILPKMDDLIRLHKVEQYLQQRSRRAQHGPAGSIFRDFGTSDCISVRYFNQSSDHQQLRQTIESKATEDRRKKIIELQNSKGQYNELIRLYREHSCTRDCLRRDLCEGRCYKLKAEEMAIKIHEWPLPREELKIKSLVFELNVPSAFCNWRDATIFLLQNVLGFECQDESPKEGGSGLFPLAEYAALLPYYFNMENRIGLASSARPHMRTIHALKFSALTITEQNVCVPNGMRYHYHDADLKVFFTHFSYTDAVLQKCTYQLPEKSSVLRRFMLREFRGQDATSNEVISSQSECPMHLPLGEYRALASICVGYNLQWKNILTQLKCPTINFNSAEAGMVIMQAIYQAGPPEHENFYRSSHCILTDKVFAVTILEAIEEVAARIKENWQSAPTLSLLISILTRVLSLTPCVNVARHALRLLSSLRVIAGCWSQKLKNLFETCENAEENARAQQFLQRMVQVALVCCQTFDVDHKHLKEIISDLSSSSILIQNTMCIHDYYSRTKHGYGGRILYQKWQQVTYRAFSLLADEVVGKYHPTCLDNAARSYWPDYQRGEAWRLAAISLPYWVASSTKPCLGAASTIHYNLLTGEFLVDGSPLARLPSEYEAHELYKDLFGEEVFEIVPSSVCGMRFSSKRFYMGNKLQFGMRDTLLLVRATTREDNQSWDLVSRHLFHGHLPDHFVDNFFHWYNVKTGVIEFRDKTAPWTRGDCWCLKFISGNWLLGKDGMRLVAPRTDTAMQIAKIFSSLKPPLSINIILQPDNQTVMIELPALSAEFRLCQGTTSILSQKQRGFQVDTDQAVGTLIGFRTMLVLKSSQSNSRKVLIPDGKPQVFRNGDHVSVSIKPSDKSVHVYDVNKRMQLLSDNGGLQSKLFLCYLHGLTSSCLADPLTRRSGTEQSLSILKSAAVKSFQILSHDNLRILKDIGALTPQREFYPNHLKVMQIVTWNEALPALSQDSHFYVVVNELLDQNEKAKLYLPDEYIKPTRLPKIPQDLVDRDLVRSSTYRIASFGAEDWGKHSDLIYSSRDLQQSSSRVTRVRHVLEMMLQKKFAKGSLTGSALQNHILEFLGGDYGPVNGPENAKASRGSLLYDAKWLTDHRMHWKDMWCWMHQHAQDSAFSEPEQRFRLIMWLATMAFATKTDLPMIHAAAALFLVPDMQAIKPLCADQLPLHTKAYRLDQGYSVLRHKVRDVIQGSLLPLEECPEWSLSRSYGEEYRKYEQRRSQTHHNNQKNSVDRFLDHVESQFPSATLQPPPGHSRLELGRYIDVENALSSTRPLFKSWYDNYRFKIYVSRVSDTIECQSSGTLHLQTLNFKPTAASLPPFTQRHIGATDAFAHPPQTTIPVQPLLLAQSLLSRTLKQEHSASHLGELVSIKEAAAQTVLEREYADDLRKSQIKWKQQSGSRSLEIAVDCETPQSTLEAHVLNTQKHASSLLKCMLEAARHNLLEKTFPEALQHSPRLSSVFFLHQLSQNGWEDGPGWLSLPNSWKPWIIAYGIAITEHQRATRLLQCMDNENDFIKELSDEGHTNWNPDQHPDSLLMEVESELMIRSVQADIAKQMRKPPNSQNTVMQLNMGEGKSSVIIPIVSASLADGSRLVRVIVAKPQSRQMFRMLVSKLGGLLNRRIFHLPFSRALRLTQSDAEGILAKCRLCMEVRGIMLVQPEHILSLKLMGIESFLSGKELLGRCLVQTQDFLDANARDLVYESDENFNTKFELIYSMGDQRAMDFAPNRWIVVQTVLGLMRDRAAKVKEELPSSINVLQRPNGFPRIRTFKKDATDRLLSLVAEDIRVYDFRGFALSRQSPQAREAVYKYITQPCLDHDDIVKVEDSTIWGETTKQFILLLRGLLAKGILAFALSRKRWRVNYGLDDTRSPPTKLALPYRAKDSPSPRSEFSHPEMIITLTCLSYYYQGLNNNDLLLVFETLVESDQADEEYQSWLDESPDLARGFRQLMGVNLKDVIQCKKDVFPAFRYNKRTIDYFLQKIVFPKYIKEFPQKLSTSGWDLGMRKAQPTTGFSGTIDSKCLLPLDVQYLGLPDQEGTNAQVLDYLLRPENGVVLLPEREPSKSGKENSTSENRAPASDAETLINLVLAQEDQSLRVILDVGAQIIELTNYEVAESWLAKAHSKEPSIKAAIYFDYNEEMMVLDYNGSAEPFWTSPYVDQLDSCLVFLDEAHTRGIDLRLPEHYRAAVTLGANLTKDRLVQACMRMRKLGKGQSILFCVPPDIQAKIHEVKLLEASFSTTDNIPNANDINVKDVLSWAISESIREIQNNIFLWAAQGHRFILQQFHWKSSASEDGTSMNIENARKFLEDEAQTLEQLYRPHTTNGFVGLPSEIDTVPALSDDFSNTRIEEIKQRCADYGTLAIDEATLEEEQERELAPEIEQERQIERPDPAKAAEHSLHPDVRSFVASGRLSRRSSAFMPAFQALGDTTAALTFDTTQFPRDVLATTDFATTVVKSTTGQFLSDAYQRPVQWILSSHGRGEGKQWQHLVIISPYEAQELLPQIRVSKHVTLHTYAPRPNQEFAPIDGLDLYTVPSSSSPLSWDRQRFPLPVHLKLQLNLFAGQLYLRDYDGYVALCRMLRLSSRKRTEDTDIGMDGFMISSTDLETAAVIRASGFKTSPVPFLGAFLMLARRDCHSIEKTHLGQILDGILLRQRDFEPGAEGVAREEGEGRVLVLRGRE